MRPEIARRGICPIPDQPKQKEAGNSCLPGGRYLFHKMGENKEWEEIPPANYWQNVFHEGLRHDGLESSVQI